ncbi:MAG: hypothetical protein V7651_06910 [Hyphomonas oceanitis]|uniref:DUF6998 domain-containing protein n=1 Tax=Hyphomonas oceanitis TaxID=81033 RepID=UPI00300241C4
MSQRIPLPPAIKQLVEARNALQAHYRASGLSFTLDGNLVGDLGEALAAEIFGLKLGRRSSEGVDGIAPDGRTVQVKSSGTSRGPVFRQVATKADHLLFFHFDYDDCSAELVFNGPEKMVIAFMPETWVGQRMASISKVRMADKAVLDQDRLLPLHKSE